MLAFEYWCVDLPVDPQVIALAGDELNIDRSFVWTLASNVADRHIVRSIIDLAHRFDFAVVAEGIEDAESLAALRDMRCDIAQGYFFGRAIPASEIPPIAEANRLPKVPAMRSA